MGFPFIAPLKKKIVEILNEREKDTHHITHYKPFVMLSSAAVVTNEKIDREGIKQKLKNNEYPPNSYFGCVIANTTDTNKLYQTGKTIVGYDLNGKAITVDGETGRMVSVPIIEKINIDTDGGNNTLKTANIEVRVFTLKQLEMFELFFLRPSMNVVLEYGWSSDLKRKNPVIAQKLYAKKDWGMWKREYVALFSVSDDAKMIQEKQELKSKYLETLETTNYEYDYMAGKITSFTISPNEDGTYSVTIEVSSGNELQLWVPVQKEKDKAKTETANKQKLPLFEQFLQKMAGDIKTDYKNIQQFAAKDKNGKYIYEKEFFNYGAYNLTQKDITASKTPYISMKVIIDLINSSKGKGKTIDYYWFDNDKGENPVIPITSREYIISTTEDFILPGELPIIIVGQNKSKEDTIIVDVKSGKKEKLLINDKSFNFSECSALYNYKDGKPIQSPKSIKLFRKDKNGKYSQSNIEFKSIGNFLNIFFNYDTLVQIWDSSYTSADIINTILTAVNDNMFGLCKLELQVPDDYPIKEPMEIIDKKLIQDKKSSKNTEIYRFKVNDIRSIVKTFQFNLELSTLMQAQALYSTQLALEAAAKSGGDIEDPVSNTIDEYTTADLSYAKNSDGYFTINVIEHELVTQALSKGTQPENENNEKPDKTKLTETITSNYVKFKKNPLDKKEKPQNFIYKDSGLIQRYLRPVEIPKSSALTYIELSLVIDGIAGLSCGEYFQVSGIPELYNVNGYFQILNVKQSIEDSDWLTEIEAGFRLNAD